MPGNEIIEIVTCQQTEFEMIGFWVANLSSLFFFSCLISSNNSGPRQKEPLDRIIILSCWQWEHTMCSQNSKISICTILEFSHWLWIFFKLSIYEKAMIFWWKYYFKMSITIKFFWNFFTVMLHFFSLLAVYCEE